MSRLHYFFDFEMKLCKSAAADVSPLSFSGGVKDKIRPQMPDSGCITVSAAFE